MKKRIKSTILLLIFLSNLIPASFPVSVVFSQEEAGEQGDVLIIDSDTVWRGDLDFGSYDYIYIENGATLKIESGSSVKLRRLELWDGRIEAIGTSDKKITISSAPFVSLSEEENDKYCFTRPSGTIYFQGYGDEDGDPESVFEYVEFVDMGEKLSYDSNNCSSMSIRDKKKGFFNIAYAAQENKNSPAIAYYSGKVRIFNSSFYDNDYADIVVDMNSYEDENDMGYFYVSNVNFLSESGKDALISNAISHSDASACVKDCESWSGSCADECFASAIIHHPEKIIFENNWYGSVDGPANETFSEGVRLSGDYVLKEWSLTEHNLFNSGISNVFFLPGIKASKLYKKGVLDTKDQLWPPNYFGNDLENLYLSEDGKSLESVYTKDVITEVGFPGIGVNIYKTFIDKLEALEEEQVIADYDIFAYDWRQNTEDVAENGTAYENGIKSAIGTLQSLSESSKSGKVTIIAHSNGGLLAKAIMLKLEDAGLSDKVDKIVFIGTPQMGTPLAVLSMLYGYDESAILGTLISRKEARNLAQNMPGAYGLLPSGKYFERVEEQFISFLSEKTRYKDFYDAYGESIGSLVEFKDFLLGEKDKREKPKEGELEKENVLNESLLAQAIEMHERLDNWIPPSKLSVVQIAGWGLDTVSGVEYKEKEQVSCVVRTNSYPICLPNGEFEPIYEPKFTVDGDKVVVAPSALMLSNAPNIKRYWVDLWSYNDSWIHFNREHKDILEVDSVVEYLENYIKNNVLLPNYFSSDKPAFNENRSRLRMSLYSPLDIHLYDEAGNHTGPKVIDIDGQKVTIFEQAIPNSYYYQFGERKYVGFSGGEKVKIEMDGYAEGAYTLKVEEIKLLEDGEKVSLFTEFANMPVSEKTTVFLEIPQNGLAEISELRADFDGDGSNDYLVAPVQNGTATLADTQAPEISIFEPQSKAYLNDRKMEIRYLALDDVSESENITVEIFIDEKKDESETIDLPFLEIGEHETLAVAIDEIGNICKKKVIFEVISDLPSVFSNINLYAQAGMIRKNEAKVLRQMVNNLIRLEKLSELVKNSKHIKLKDKEKLEKTINRLLEKHIGSVMEFIKKRPDRFVSREAKSLLMGSLEYVKRNY